MPNAEVSTETRRFELKTCDGAYVVIKKFGYGERLKIRSLSARAHIAQQEIEEKRKEAKAKKQKFDPDDIDTELSMDMESVVAYEFKKGITEHNLEKKDGTPFNFSSRADFARLEPAIGEEIEDLIDEFNPEVSAAKKDEGEEGESPFDSESGKQSQPELVTT